VTRIVVTGADGFVAQNLIVRARENRDWQVVPITRASTRAVLTEAVAGADVVFHLAGVNRPENEAEFATGNVEFTQQVIAAVAAAGGTVPIVFSSSIQAEQDNPYGRSKKAAEDALLAFAQRTGTPVHLFRLPNVFGKWSRPNYNSAVVTFCHNIARGLPVTVHDPAAPVRLVYVDDVVEAMLALVEGHTGQGPFHEVAPEYRVTVGELKERIEGLRDARAALTTERVGAGFERALHATFLSYLPVEDFTYPLPVHDDPRGRFAEMLKTADSGQFSFFTAHPGVTRGGHYHHTKTEKFLVVRGQARFNFRHLVTQQRHSLEVSGERPQIVETIPGWSHDITNIGAEEMIVMLWANEVFDRARPDTYAAAV
jgi:UDP-2-acetamido-2,6-beta-L-arabino-hexul-4-ose reductase